MEEASERCGWGGGVTNHTEIGAENMVSIGFKTGMQQAVDMVVSVRDEGGGKKPRSNICLPVYGQNSPKVGVASLERPQVNK